MESTAPLLPPPPDFGARDVYDAAEVDDYIAHLESEVETLRAELAAAQEAARDGALDRAAVEHAESLLGRALLSAQRAADETVADARRAAEQIISEARRRAERILADAETSGHDVPADDLRSVAERARKIVAEAQQSLDALLTERREEHPAHLHRAPANGRTGRIVELPRSDSTPHRPREPESPPRLQLTGTEAFAAPATAPVPHARHEAPPAPLPRQSRPATFGDGLKERFRLLRGGPAAFNESLFGRSGHLDSLQDGTYLDDLRRAPETPRVRKSRRSIWSLIS